MLRNRRQSLSREPENEVELAQGGKMHKKVMKLKMSPFPEIKGVPLKESSHRLNKLTEVKTSLQFELGSQCTDDTSTLAENSRSHAHATLSDSTTTLSDFTTTLSDSTTTLSDSTTTLSDSHATLSDSTTTLSDSTATKHELSSIVKPKVEYVVPDTPNTAAAPPEREDINLTSFPPRSCASTESTLKPSSVHQLERHMTSKRGGGSSGREGASITSVWDNVVSWMRQAVDFVTVEADPTTPTAAQGKKRRRPGDRNQSIPGCKAPKLTNQRAPTSGKSRTRQSRRDSKRMSFGGFQTKSSEGLADLLSNNLPPISETTSPKPQKTAPIQSPTSVLTSQFSHTLTVKSPHNDASMNPILNPALLKFTSQRLQSTNHGLNSILDRSPAAVVPRKKQKKIRRQSLSQYYGRSVDSPNLREVPGELISVRRSPRLANKGTPSGMVPPPPPPLPTLPPTPQAPLPPPVPKIPSMYECDLNQNDTPTRSGVDQSRTMLQNMQSRLRTRMKHTTVGGGPGERGRGKQFDAVDIKTRQWAEIQALSRKISISDFLTMAEDKKKHIKKALEEVQLKVPQTMAGITEIVELLQDGSQWFPGGVKEMRDSLPLYKALEKKVELLNEFTQLSGQMCNSRLPELPEGMHYSELHTALAHMRSEFDSKHRYWGPVVLSNAQSWQEVGLPVCPQLMLRSREYVCHLVGTFIKCTLMEAGKIQVVHLSLKCVRTKQVKERLRECLQLMSDSQSYFQVPTTTESCPGCDHCCLRAVYAPSTGCCMSTLLKYILDVSLSFIRIALGQFDGFVSKSKRQDVCEHFESVLKVTNLVKSLVCELHQTRPSHVKASGVIPLIPGGEPLGNEIYRSCVTLIQHILGQTGSSAVEQVISPRSKDKLSKEVILWMMFGCKYVHQTLEVLGSDKANARGVASLLGELQQMEDLLP